MTYDRFWDLCISADDSHYDFTEEIGVVEAYRVQKNELQHGQHLNLVQCNQNKTVVPLPLEQNVLPDTGYVVSVLSFRDFKNRHDNEQVQQLIRWILRPAARQTGKGNKLRVTCHGAAGGDIAMYRLAADAETRHADVAQMSEFMEWFTGQGLRSEQNQPAGLKVVALNCCYSGTGAYWGWYKSAVVQCAKALTRANLTGIKVTGASKEMHAASKLPHDILFESQWRDIRQGLTEAQKKNQLNKEISEGLSHMFNGRNQNGRFLKDFPQAGSEKEQLNRILSLPNDDAKIEEIRKICLIWCKVRSIDKRNEKGVSYDPFELQPGQTAVIMGNHYRKFSKMDTAVRISVVS